MRNFKILFYKVSVLPSKISLKFLSEAGKEHIKEKALSDATKKAEKLNQKTVVRIQMRLKIHSKAITAALISLFTRISVS